MIFVKSVTVPANTVAATPLKLAWNLALGLVYKVEVMFPPGPGGLVGVALHNAIHRIYPVADEEWFIGDNYTISFDDYYKLTAETKQLEIHAYNLDEYYDHSVQVRLGLETDPELIQSRYTSSNIKDLIDRITTLNNILVAQNLASGKFNTKILDSL